MSKIVIDIEDIDIILRRNLPECESTNWRIALIMEGIRKRCFSIKEWNKWDQVRIEMQKKIDFWKTPSKYKVFSLEERIENCAKKLTQLRNGEVVESGRGGSIYKKNNQYNIHGHQFTNCWKAAKFLCR